jgi:hypothetical protein
VRHVEKIEGGSKMEEKRIQVRVTPLLKALGFKHVGGSLYNLYADEGGCLFQARVSKKGGKERYLEIIKNVWDEHGDLDHRETLVKDLPMDYPSTFQSRSFLEFAIDDLIKALPAPNEKFIVKNVFYLLGLTDERVEV